MAQNLEESVKIVKNALEANGVYPDAVNKNKDGHIVVRDTFFYKAGRTAEGHTHKVKKALDAAGIKHSIVDDGEHWAPFRGGATVAKSSHFYTHVKLHEDALEEGSNVPSHLYHKPSYVADPSAMAGDHHTTPEQRRAAKVKRLKAKAPVSEAVINEVSKDLLKRYVAKGDRSYDNLLDKTLDSWKSAEDNQDRPAERRKHQTNAVRLGRKADRRALSLNKADARLNEENDLRTQIFKPSFAGNAVSDHNKHLAAIHKKLGRGEIEQIDSLHHTFDNPYGKTTVLTTPHGTHITHVIHTREETMNEAYPSAAAMSRKAKAVKQARAVANGYANQKSGKWKSESYKLPDGRWASKDVKEEAGVSESFEPGTRVYNKVNKQRGVVLRPNRDLKNRALLAVKYDNGSMSAHKAHVLVKEETLVEKYKRATGRARLNEASSQTLVATKGSDKASRYEMHTNMPGEASEYSSIIKTHQDGKPLQNRWGGYNTLRTGKTAYVKKHFAQLGEDLDLNESTIGSWSNAGPFIRVTKGTDRVTKKPARHVEIHDMGNKTRLITSVHPDWKNEDIKNHLVKTHGKKLDSVHWNLDEEVITELSKGTLGSYIKKASNDVASKAVEYGTKKAERDEVDRITNRHMKYADKDTIHQALKTTSDDVEGPRVKAAKRIGGISKAVNKLTNEEVQLDEAPYYSLEASKARMAKEKARATAKAAIAAAKVDSSIARKEARENRSLHIARHIEAEVGNHYPDSDGFEAISNKVRKLGIPHHEVIDHLDKAARKHLGAKSFDHYVDNFHKDAQGSN
jgi:hypothetical protein